jgi:hypothetical protein
VGAKAGRKGGRTYNLLTCGVSSWRKYLDKTRRKAAKAFAIEEQDLDPECKCCSLFGYADSCRCGCGCCTEERPTVDSVDDMEAEHGEADTHPDTQVARQTRGEDPEQGT